MYGLTTQLSKDIQMYSNIPLEEKRQIRNVSVKKADLKFDSSTKALIELLEVLQHHKEIEDLNYKKLQIFWVLLQNIMMKKAENILGEIGYKKSTIASLKNVLNHTMWPILSGKYLKRNLEIRCIGCEKSMKLHHNQQVLKNWLS